MLTAGQQVLRSGGVVRGIENWGVFALPNKIIKYSQGHNQGHYFVMRFDASAGAQAKVTTTMRMDPRVLRVTSVRLGDGKLGNVATYSGPSWNRLKG